MTNVITNTAFVGRYLIANQVNADVALVLNNFVTTYQPVFLRQLLGPVLYKQFQDWLDLPLPRPQVGIQITWQALLDGTNFTTIWGVPSYSEKISIALTSYCYDRYQRNNVTQTTGVGEKETDAQNTSQGSVQQKLIDRWNEMVNNTRGNFDYLNVQLQDNDDWRNWYRYVCGFYGNPYTSLMAELIMEYPKNEIFTRINQFGL